MFGETSAYFLKDRDGCTLDLMLQLCVFQGSCNVYSSYTEVISRVPESM